MRRPVVVSAECWFPGLWLLVAALTVVPTGKGFPAVVAAAAQMSPVDSFHADGHLALLHARKQLSVVTARAGLAMMFAAENHRSGFASGKGDGLAGIDSQRGTGGQGQE
jgi:hypothetical protein